MSAGLNCDLTVVKNLVTFVVGLVVANSIDVSSLNFIIKLFSSVLVVGVDSAGDERESQCHGGLTEGSWSPDSKVSEVCG